MLRGTRLSFAVTQLSLPFIRKGRGEAQMKQGWGPRWLKGPSWWHGPVYVCMSFFPVPMFDPLMNMHVQMPLSEERRGNTHVSNRLGVGTGWAALFLCIAAATGMPLSYYILVRRRSPYKGDSPTALRLKSLFTLQFMVIKVIIAHNQSSWFL